MNLPPIRPDHVAFREIKEIDLTQKWMEYAIAAGLILVPTILAIGLIGLIEVISR